MFDSSVKRPIVVTLLQDLFNIIISIKYKQFKTI